jgi:hypothetical protein
MATVKELLQDRVESLRDLADRMQQELEAEADLEKLSSLADELAAAGDSFAATLTKAQETLAEDGDEDQGGEGEEQGERQERGEDRGQGKAEGERRGQEQRRGGGDGEQESAGDSGGERREDG